MRGRINICLFLCIAALFCGCGGDPVTDKGSKDKTEKVIVTSTEDKSVSSKVVANKSPLENTALASKKAQSVSGIIYFVAPG